ncbi:MAG: hypothetical protein ACFFDR_04835 [Candidatus Thorarchaeota archaeon]
MKQRNQTRSQVGNAAMSLEVDFDVVEDDDRLVPAIILRSGLSHCEVLLNL